MAHHRCGQTLSCQLPFDIFVVTEEMVDSSHSIENGLSNVCDVVHGPTLGDPGRCRHSRAAFLTPMITALRANISTAPWSSLRWSDLFITRELHTRKALDWPAIAASTKTTQPGQNDQTEVMYAQNTPMRTPLAVGRRRCANCPAFVNIGLVRQARVALR